MLTKNQLKDVCLKDCGHLQCRYLDEPDSHNNYNYQCLKLIKSKKDLIDISVKNFINQCKANNKDEKDEDMPIGDNCSGYPFLIKMSQGYDIKS